MDIFLLKLAGHRCRDGQWQNCSRTQVTTDDMKSFVSLCGWRVYYHIASRSSPGLFFTWMMRVSLACLPLSFRSSSPICPLFLLLLRLASRWFPFPQSLFVFYTKSLIPRCPITQTSPCLNLFPSPFLCSLLSDPPLPPSLHLALCLVWHIIAILIKMQRNPLDTESLEEKRDGEKGTDVVCSSMEGGEWRNKKIILIIIGSGIKPCGYLLHPGVNTHTHSVPVYTHT